MKNIDNYNSGEYFPKQEEGEESLGGLKSWLNENGKPDYEYLQSLASESTPENLERLRLIAEDLDVDHHSNISANELVERIRLTLNKADNV